VKLESENPGIYQALRVDPIDLMSQRAKMKDNEVVLQYIPSENNLNIQFVSKERLLLTTVAVDKTFLINLVEKTKLKLQNSANTRGAMVDDLVEDDDSLALKSLLHELYKYLIAPIEKELTSNQIIYVIPNGELSNIPFAALIKDLETEKYLVEEYNFGYLSSLYLYQLIFDVEKKNNGSFALFGDPDGSLPGARKEVEDIGAMVHTETYCGSKASTTNFIKKIDKARYVHIASHGYLDDKNLKDSWLLFSDKKLKLTEAFDLPLSESELVVLSACETSSGSSGMEYATLARSFCNAGAETVVATLWQVNDKASQQLMTYFYEELTKGLNRFAALANAQRRLLKSEYNDPGKWAAYIPIGKP
jgi:CHAT domain-containing protein